MKKKNTESNGIRPDAEFGRALVARRKQSLILGILGN
jgi:hypothetical protein